MPDSQCSSPHLNFGILLIVAALLDTQTVDSIAIAPGGGLLIGGVLSDAYRSQLWMVSRLTGIPRTGMGRSRHGRLTVPLLCVAGYIGSMPLWWYATYILRARCNP